MVEVAIHISASRLPVRSRFAHGADVHAGGPSVWKQYRNRLQECAMLAHSVLAGRRGKRICGNGGDKPLFIVQYETTNTAALDLQV